MSGENRDFKGIWCPREVWLDKRLTALEKIILMEIDSLDGIEGCYASNEYLADFCQCSVRKITGAITKLKSLGYVSTTFNGRERMMHTHVHSNFPQPSKICESAPSESTEQTSKNCESATQNLPQRILIENKGSYQNPYNNGPSQKRAFENAIDGYTDSPELKDAIHDFIEMRKTIKAPLTERALKLMLANLDRLAGDDAEKVAVLDQSIANSWKGVFPLRDGYGQRGRKEVVIDAELASYGI